MARTPSTDLHWDEDDPSPVLEWMSMLRSARTGWINLRPEVADGHETAPRSLGAWLFSSRGDAVPMITWTAPTSPSARAGLGIEHGAGPRALDRLADEGLPRPASWFRRVDHARRGLVLEPDAGSGDDEVLAWALDAAHRLTTVPLTGRWLATVYRPER